MAIVPTILRHAGYISLISCLKPLVFITLWFFKWAGFKNHVVIAAVFRGKQLNSNIAKVIMCKQLKFQLLQFGIVFYLISVLVGNIIR